VGNIPLSFAGTRFDQASTEYEPYDKGNYSAIALAPARELFAPTFYVCEWFCD